MNRTVRSRLFILLALLPVFTGCGSEIPTHPLVLVTVPPQGRIVEILAGNAVEVHVLVPPGAHPASYSPGQESMRRVSQATLYLTLGSPHFPFEGTWMERIRAQNPHLTLVPAQEAGSHEEDPHVWTGPSGFRRLITAAEAALAELVPEQAETIRENARELRAQVSREEQEIRALVQPGQRFYVFHPAWGAFARDFGLEQVAIEEHGKEPSPGHLKRTIERARQDAVKVILVQPQFSQQGARVVAEAIGAEVAVVDPLNPDWFEEMRRMRSVLPQALVRGTP